MDEIKKIILELKAEKKYDCKKIYNLSKLIKKTEIDESLINWLKEECKNGNSHAQNNLGDMYYYGKKVKTNYKEAIRLYKLSAEQGHTIAQYKLGEIYENGYGVKNDYKEALRLYKLSAEQGNTDAQTSLGDMYHFGRGVETDYKEARRLYKLSADQGELYAQYNLGVMYYYGLGVEKDYGEAIRWFELSAEQGNENAKYYLQKIKDELFCMTMDILYNNYVKMKELEEKGGPEYREAKKRYEDIAKNNIFLNNMR